MEPRPESWLFRVIIGVIVMLTAIGGFAALFFIKVPIENKDAMMFALGAVFQWAAGVVASEYGATTTGRRVADQAVRSMERQALASEQQPSGTPGDPVAVEEVGKP